jgi:O-antigen/teichoic acid export membrane protein
MSAASRIWVTLAGGVTTIVLARVLGPNDWGTYSIAVSLIAILGAVAALGVDQGIAYFVGSGRWEPRPALESALRMAGVAGVLAATVGLVARAIVPSAFAGLSVPLTVVAVAAVPFVLALAYASSIALATDRYEASQSMPAVLAGLTLAASIPAALVFGGAGAVSALTLATAVTALGAIAWSFSRLPQAHSRQPGQLRRAVSFGIRGYAANTLQLVNYQLDLFILAAVAPAAVVGQYALAVRATILLVLLPEALSVVLTPRVARLGASGDEQMREIVEEKSLRHVGLIAVVGMVTMAAALELLLVPVFGEEYRPAINLGLILLPGAAAIGVTAVLASIVIGRGKPEYSLYSAVVVTPLTVLMYATLIPWLHAPGAALASTLSYLATCALMCWFFRRVAGRSPLPLLVPGRSEIDDLRALPRSGFAWARTRRR